jgi:prevent-host-death family protein
MYTLQMDVAVSELRAHLSEWLEQAREGTEVVVTDRGVPVARLLGLEATSTLERLTVEGVIARPAQAKRPTASGRRRPSARTNMAELVSEQRR